MEKKNNVKIKRIVAIDYLKAFAAILVILTHVLTKSERIKVGGPFWISMAVPIFMILSGFTNSLSADKKEISSLKEFYQKDAIIREFSVFLSPYLLIILGEFFLGLYQLFILKTGPFLAYTMKDYIIYFLTGGTTPGSYYIPIMFQFVLLFPIMYRCYKQIGKKSVYFYLALHFLFDYLANYLPIPTEIYRLLIFRYLAFIVLGIALYFSYQEVKNTIKYMKFLSIAYILAYTLGYRLKMFSKWPNTALPTVFWALTLVVLSMEFLEKEPNCLVSNLLIKIGKASYYIFLIQKFLFGFGLNNVLNSLGLSTIGRSISAIILCCSLGLAFYSFDQLGVSK